MVDISVYKVGVVDGFESCASKKGGKELRACLVRIEPDSDETITVVTSAPNVREGSRVVVAPIGATFIDEEGEERTVAKATVGGVVSQGMMCDSIMLGWSGGARGVAAQVPDSFDIGSAPPSLRPRKDMSAGEGTNDSTGDKPAEDVGLFEKKLTKEEKKKLAEERRKARKAAKAAKAAEAGSSS